MQTLVSVIVLAYNQEKYIAQCIEGILMQKADFPFEIVIGEDFSTDRTREIVLEYQNKYPDKLNVILSPQNLGPAQNVLQIQQSCRGKYLALCEGDDYWIDPLKLKKQVDFMESHPDVTLCFHNALILNETNSVTRLYFETPPKEILGFADACQIHTPTASVMARSDTLASLPEWRLKIWCGDLLIHLWCAHHGNLGYLNEIMSVYRFHAGGMSASFSRQKKAYEGVIFLYKQFDIETHYKHTDLLKVLIGEVEEGHRCNRNMIVYYITHPIKFLARLKIHLQALRRYRSLYVFKR
jgi:glycosyltransferase involved in cell wall biosynthesis